jgi:uncharacterized protein YjiS (DUF1127 family)
MSADNPPIRHATAVQRIVRSLVEAAFRIVEDVSSGYRRRNLLNQLEALDDRTLRDLGLHRAELVSVVAELMDAAPSSSGTSSA